MRNRDKALNYNIQSYVDVRVIASICRELERRGSASISSSMSEVLRFLINHYHESLRRNPDYAIFETASAAMQWLASRGYPTTQLGDVRGKKLLEQLSLDDVLLDASKGDETEVTEEAIEAALKRLQG